MPDYIPDLHPDPTQKREPEAIDRHVEYLTLQPGYVYFCSRRSFGSET